MAICNFTAVLLVQCISIEVQSQKVLWGWKIL